MDEQLLPGDTEEAPESVSSLTLFLLSSLCLQASRPLGSCLCMGTESEGSFLVPAALGGGSTLAEQPCLRQNSPEHLQALCPPTPKPSHPQKLLDRSQVRTKES